MADTRQVTPIAPTLTGLRSLKLLFAGYYVATQAASQDFDPQFDLLATNLRTPMQRLASIWHFPDIYNRL